jgi:RHS repeat-associated protein
MKSTGTIYWYGAGADVLMETTFANSEKASYTYFAGKRMAITYPNNETDFYQTDHLGNSRVVGSLAGNNVTDFYPFGGERVISTGTPTNYKFTGKERDSESGLDNFGARYNSSSLGRFMSPDPRTISLRKMIDAQQWSTFWPLLQKQGGMGGHSVATSNLGYDAFVLADDEELGGGGAPLRMLYVGGEFGQRDEDETAQVHARMGELQFRGVNGLLPIEQDVDVDQSRAAGY